MNKQQLTQDELRQLPYLKVQHCPVVVGVSQGLVRELINSGKLPVVRRGRCIFVKKQLLMDVLDAENK